MGLGDIFKIKQFKTQIAELEQKIKFSPEIIKIYSMLQQHSAKSFLKLEDLITTIWWMGK